MDVKYRLPGVAVRVEHGSVAAGGDAAILGNGGGAPITVAITDTGVDLAKKTVCIKVRLSTMGNTRKVSTSHSRSKSSSDSGSVIIPAL